MTHEGVRYSMMQLLRNVILCHAFRYDSEQYHPEFVLLMESLYSLRIHWWSDVAHEWLNVIYLFILFLWTKLDTSFFINWLYLNAVISWSVYCECDCNVKRVWSFELMYFWGNKSDKSALKYWGLGLEIYHRDIH